MPEIHTCPSCQTNTRLDVCPDCNMVLVGDHKGKDYTDLDEKEQKGLSTC